jgi:hypothetical protein
MADDADDQTSDRFLEVYLLWLFGWVLFCESAGDSVSRCMIPCPWTYDRDHTWADARAVRGKRGRRI